MDRWTLLLVVLAVAAVIGGFALEGGNPAVLWNPAALLIVLAGSVLATLVQASAGQLRALSRLLFWLISPPRFSLDILLSKLTVSGHALRRDGPQALEKVALAEQDLLLRKALMLMADGSDSDSLRDALMLELKIQDERDLDVVSLLDSLAGYLPTLGIVGAVLGLMQVLSSIKEPDVLAAGIATAFVATFYGVAGANLIVIPVASALRQRLALRRRYYEAMMLGVMSLREGLNPMALRHRLHGIVL